MNLYTSWVDSAPTEKLRGLASRVPSQARTVNSDERLKHIVEKVVGFWATSINHTIPTQPTESCPDVALYRYMTRVASLSKNAPSTVLTICDFREYVLWNLRGFARVVTHIGSNPLSLAFGVSHETFIDNLAQFMACNRLKTQIHTDPVLASFVDCSYDVAVDAFQCPISSS